MILAVMAAAALMVQPPMLLLDMPPPSYGSRGGDYVPVIVRIYPNGVLKFEGVNVPLSKLAEVVALRSYSGLDERIFIVANDDTPYGTVEAVIAALKDAGFRRIGLVSGPDDTLPD